MSIFRKIEKFLNDNCTWRLSFYRKVLFYKKYLKNYKDVLHENFKTLEFRGGQRFFFTDSQTCLDALYDIFVAEVYRLPRSDKEKIIFDIGANIGLFSLYSFYRVPKASIFSFEADPCTFGALERNIKENSLQGSIKTFNLAVYSSKSNMPFFCHKVSGWGSIFSTEQYDKQVRIDTTDIYSFCKDQGISSIDFIKMDVEGAEYDILLGDKNFFSIPIEEIVIEADRNPRDQRYRFDDLVDCLRRHYNHVRLFYPGSGSLPILHCRSPKKSDKF